MDAETVIWTLILFGGTVLAVVWLTYAAWRKEKEGAEKEGAEKEGAEKEGAEKDGAGKDGAEEGTT